MDYKNWKTEQQEGYDWTVKILNGIDFIASVPDFLSLSDDQTRGSCESYTKTMCYIPPRRLNFFTQRVVN